MSEPILQIQVQRAPADCGVCALSMYLGVPYEDVLAQAVKTTANGRVHHRGMFVAEIKRTARRLGVSLTLRRSFDMETDEGIVSLGRKDQGHVAVLKAGLIFDGDGTVWEPDTYLLHYGYRVCSLLVRGE